VHGRCAVRPGEPWRLREFREAGLADSNWRTVPGRRIRASGTRDTDGYAIRASRRRTSRRRRRL